MKFKICVKGIEIVDKKYIDVPCPEIKYPHWDVYVSKELQGKYAYVVNLSKYNDVNDRYRKYVITGHGHPNITKSYVCLDESRYYKACIIRSRDKVLILVYES